MSTKAPPPGPEPVPELWPGDVLSYSAGSTQCGPLGFRKLHDDPGPFAAAMSRWPEFREALGEHPPLFINAYPAAVGVVSAGITVDTYLSPRVMSRALQLGALADHPVILCAQPLFLVDALLQHVRAERALPATLLAFVGGYVMPRSLERMLEAMLAGRVARLMLLQGYGTAEVDAGCMLARERDLAGRLVYHPRDDVEPELEGDSLLLTLRGPSGEPKIERFATGDRAERLPGGGWLLWNHERLHPLVHAELESWTDADWRRRTGYLRREGETVWIQLRLGEDPTHERELDHWDFGRAYGFSWLDKPYWR